MVFQHIVQYFIVSMNTRMTMLILEQYRLHILYVYAQFRILHKTVKLSTPEGAVDMNTLLLKLDCQTLGPLGLNDRALFNVVIGFIKTLTVLDCDFTNIFGIKCEALLMNCRNWFY